MQKNFLDSLPVVTIPTKTGGRGPDPVATGRGYLIKGINAQKDAVNNELANKPLPKTTFQVDGENRSREFARWYTQLDDGYVCTVRYGQVPVVKTQKDGKEVAAYWPAGKTLKDVLAFFNNLIAAIERGELDERIKELQKPRPRNSAATPASVAAPGDRADTRALENT